MEDTNDVMELQEQEKEIIDDIDSYIPQPKEFEVIIQNPMTITYLGKQKCLSFQLLVVNADDVLPLAQTDHVRRTFHDFMWLREILKTRHDPEIIPSLYKKYRIEYKVGFYYTVKQQKSMYDFTEACFKLKALVSDPLLSLFYQSDLDICELEDFMMGKYDDEDEFLAEIWAKKGITKSPMIDYWDKVTSDEYYQEVICKNSPGEVVPTTCNVESDDQDS